MVKIGYLSWSNPKDRKSSSGTTYKISEALGKCGYEVVWIPVDGGVWYRFYSRYLSLKRRLFHKNNDAAHSLFGTYLISKSIDRSLIEDCDILFAPFSSTALYGLETKIPVIYLTDAVFNQMVGYYWFDLSESSIRQGNVVEQRALDQSSAIIVSSKWAYDSVVKDYGQPASKVHVIEFGANIDEKDMISRQWLYTKHLDLLFLGVDWERKGGDLAVEACRWLNENGLAATLHVVGIKELDKGIKDLPFVDYAGFLDKNVPDEYNKLVRIIKSCHCLLLPTLAECAGIAFCESSANGLPVFSHDTGGTRNYVEDGRNGYLLPLGSSGADFGRKIKSCLEIGEMQKMAEIAREVYREKLNWDVWGCKANQIIRQFL